MSVVFVLSVYPTSGVRQASTVSPLPPSGPVFRGKKGGFFIFCFKKMEKKFKKKWPDVRSDESLTSHVRRQSHPTWLTIIIVLLTSSPLYLIYLVRLGDYIVNLYSFYSDRFFAASGVNLPFHFLRVSFSSQLKYKVGNILTKPAALRINSEIPQI